jgi:hypothetical protein
MATTHFAAIQNSKVIDTRSSTSRHAEGTGRFGLYTHAIVRTDRIVTRRPDGSEQVEEQSNVISYHGQGNANDGLRAANVGASFYQDASGSYYIERGDKVRRLRADDPEIVRIVTYARAEIVPVIVTPKKAKIGQVVA